MLPNLLLDGVEDGFLAIYRPVLRVSIHTQINGLETVTVTWEVVDTLKYYIPCA